MKWPNILKVVALPNFEYFEVALKWVTSYLRITVYYTEYLSLATSHVVPNLLIINLWPCPLGAINKKCFL